jgi:hypothetical protein
MSPRQALLLLGAAFGPLLAAAAKAGVSVNPIRRVVTMLQMMEKKVTEEGEKDKELYDKFMCYCQTGEASLSKSVAEATAKIPQLESDLKAGKAEEAQLTSDIAECKADREAAMKTMSEAKSIRLKTTTAFEKEQSEMKADVGAMTKAIFALEKGLSGFLQTQAATVLRRLVVSTDLSLEARDTLTSFLSQGTSEEDQSYEPSTGEIIGILKQMKETMEKEMAEASSAESESVKEFTALMAAKTKEVEALTQAMESKIARVGEAGVENVNTANDLESTEKQLAEDTKFLAGLENTCKVKAEEWEITEKLRSQELVALADTVKLLNDDDALDLFKKTLPTPSFLQLQVTSKETLSSAREALRASFGVHDYRLDLISMAMRGKAPSFDKVIGMVDDMMGLLKKEQADDNKKKGYCLKDLDKAEDEKKELTFSESDLEKTIEDEKETIASLAEEIASLEDGIKALDKSVVEATTNRKEENAAYVETLAANTAAVEIIKMAKNRLSKFYNPKLYKAPPKREMTEEQRISVNMGGTLAPTAAPDGISGTDITAFNEEAPSFVQISAHFQDEDEAAPPPPPETVDAYQKREEESNGVMQMMDILIEDLAKETTEMKVDEKNAQAEYETFIKDSAEKRAADSKAIAEKEAAKADTAAKLQKHGAEKKETNAELKGNLEYTMGLHKSCDWLLQNYDVRKTARAGEADALSKAKAVLSGADYSA